MILPKQMARRGFESVESRTTPATRMWHMTTLYSHFARKLPLLRYRDFMKRVWEMSSQLFVTLYTLSIYPSAHKQLRWRLPTTFQEFPCKLSICKVVSLRISLKLFVASKLFISTYTVNSISIRYCNLHCTHVNYWSQGYFSNIILQEHFGLLW